MGGVTSPADERDAEATLQESTHSLAAPAPRPESGHGKAATSPPEHSGPTIGRYELKGVLGRGGMGIVYDAWDPALERWVAIKILSLTSSMSTHGRERFQREAQAVARLDHPHIIRMHDIGEVNGNTYLVMPKLQGPTLRALLKEIGPLPPHQAASIVKVLAEALECAHQAGLVHRDVKPSNVILEGGARVVLTDFGVAKDLTLPSSNLTQDRRLVGTPAYMAPEQRAGENAAVGPAADIFALGLVLWESLSGARPKVGEDGAWALKVEGPARVPRPLRAVCGRAIRVDPDDRYPTALAMAEDLGRYLRGEPVLATKVGLGRRVHGALRSPLKMRWGALIVGLLTLALLVRLGLSLSQTLAHRAREATAVARLEALETHVDALRAAGDHDGAEAAVQRFVAMDSNTQTRAVALAWLGHAQGVDDTDLKLEALASAYATATQASELEAALVGLAHSYAAKGRWIEVSAVLRTAALRTPTLLQSPEMAQLEAQRAIASREFLSLAQVEMHEKGAPLQRLAAAFSTATATAHVFEGEAVAALDSPSELVLFSLMEAKVRALSLADASLPEVWSEELPKGAGPMPRVISIQSEGGTDGAELLTWQGASRQAALMGREGSGLQILHSWPSAAIGDALRLDLDHDGVGEIYVGTLAYQRDLQVLRPEGEGWRHEPAHQPTNLAASDITAMAPLDVDGDGLDELSVAVGPWVAYDLRALGYGDTDELEIVARRQLGTVSAMARVPGAPDRLLVFKGDLFPNPRAFSPVHPYGPQEGLYVLRLESGQFVVDAALSTPEGWRPERTLVADVDGDGLEDVVAWRVTNPADRAVVALQAADGQFTLASIEGITPLAAAQLDNDDAQELIVSLNDEGRRIYVLGTGEGVIPPREIKFPSPPPPPEGDPDMVAVWERADDLAFIGLPIPAARLMQEIATLTLNEAVAQLALMRAADLFQQGDRPEEAALVLEECAALGGSRAPQALATAAQIHRRYNNTEAAAASWAALASLPGAPEALRDEAYDALDLLAPLLSPALNFSLTQAVPLEAPWSVRSARGLRWGRAEGGLLLDFIADPGSQALASLPMLWAGEPITLIIEMNVTRLEWGAQIFVGLRSDEGQRFGFLIAGSGGSAMLQRDVSCIIGRAEPSLQLPTQGADEKTHLRLRLDLMPDGHARCAIAPGRGAPLRAIGAPIPAQLSPGDFYLEIGPTRGPFLGYQHARAQLEALTLRGVSTRPSDGASGPLNTIHLALSGGASKIASQLLASEGEGLDAITSHLLRAQIAEDQGEADRATEAFEAALLAGLEAPPHRPALLSLLREGPERFNDPTRAVLGDEAWLEAFGEAWQVAAALHETDRVVGETLIHSLDAGIISDLGDRTPLTLIDLLYARGHVWRSRAQHGLALTDLSRALALIEKMPMDPDRSQASAIPRLRAELLIDLAELETHRGHPKAALSHLREAQEISPITEITLDRINASEALRPLHTTPEWQALVGDAPRWTDLPKIDPSRR